MHSLKTRFIPTAVILAILGVAAVAVVPQFGKNDNGNGEERSVVLTVDFIPVKRNYDKDVTIARTIAGTSHPGFFHHDSPWIEAVTVKRGSTISLTVTQYTNGYLRCVITQNKSNFHERERNTLGTVKCRLTVT